MTCKTFPLFVRVACATLILAVYLFPQVPIPPSDPSYIYLRQAFRRSHNLHLLITPFPFTGEHFTSLPYYSDGHDVYVRIAPNAKLRSDRPDFHSGVWISGASERISFLVEPQVVSKGIGYELFGDTYSRFGMRGRFTNAFIRYAAPSVLLQLGRSPIWWGQSWESSVIQSGNAPAYDYVSGRFTFGSFSLELLTGQLSSDTTDGQRIKRFVAGHRLTWLPPHQKWIFSFGEQTIYTGKDRSIELYYLNPLAPFSFSAFEHEQEEVPSGEFGDNDNSMYFAEARYLLSPNISIFGEFLMDDFQITLSARDDIPDALAWKLGMDGGTILLERDLTFEVEYTHVDSWTYIHHGQFTNWHNRGIPLGYQHGPDSWSLFAAVDYWLTSRLLFQMSDTYLQKGSLTIMSKWEANGTAGDPFPSTPVSHGNLFRLSALWHGKRGILELGWEGDVDAMATGSLYARLQWITGVGFDMN